jgi:hypothetical protein
VLRPPLGARFLLFGLGVFALYKCNLGLLPLLKKKKKKEKKRLEVDKEEIIQKQLQVLYKGEAQPFKRLYKSMQDFSNDIMQVQEGCATPKVCTLFRIG